MFSIWKCGLLKPEEQSFHGDHMSGKHGNIGEFDNYKENDQ